MISINGITVAYGSYTLLDNINFHISESDKIGLVGKNGAGKSTIMKLICGEQSPTSGHIDLPNHIKIGYLPQIMQHNKGRTVIDEAMTAFAAMNELETELAEIGNELAERTDYESEEYMSLISRMNEINDRLAIEHSEPPMVQAEKTLLGLGFKDEDFSRNTETFSQGWNMRIELAKILLSKPDVLLLDEPIAGLDPMAMEDMHRIIAEMNRPVSERPLPGHPHLSGGVAVVMVSHDVAAAVRYADHILHLGNHGAWFGTTAAYLETPEGRRFAAKGKEGETV